ncbi:TOMM precursor leader peptide-binding protein [Streptacidiphilus neutrinimicus]|uniref:TOMM precursor leader peptide-binding protein n=1 Tax=Streptacidiphilus neutrinimicus TaxID=105420 RepID=UPI000A0144CC|nr:TOMM precursor leader peptide-binding protein [Streptacidiphilus neutrinimicus]
MTVTGAEASAHAAAAAVVTAGFAAADHPLAAAGERLRLLLADEAERLGRPAPDVAWLGDADALASAASYAPASGASHGLADRARATVHLAADAVLVGPWGGDGTAEGTACGVCLAMRRQRLRGSAERDALETGRGTTAAAAWPLPTAGLATAVLAVHEAVTGEAPPADGLTGGDRRLRRVTRIDLATWHTVTVPLLPEALCPVCREADEQAAAPEPGLALLPRPRPAHAYRLRTPEAYALPATALANPVCGALGAGTRTDLTSPTTAPVAGAVLLRTSGGLNEMTWSGKTGSFRRSRHLGLLEGLERYASTRRQSLAPPLVASYDSLGDAALDPRDCGVYAPETYAAEQRLQPFDPARPIPWVPGWSLRDQRPVLVARRSAYYFEGSAGDDFVDECSNGCATGSCLEEAVLFGLLEVVERDAFLLSWYGGASLTGIDLHDGAPAAVRGMLDRAELLGYRLHVLDTRADLPIPSVAAVAVRRDGGPGHLSFAAAAALDPAAAVESALAETLTYLPGLAGRVSARTDELEAMAEDFTLVRRQDDHPALFGLPRMAAHAATYLTPSATVPLASLGADRGQGQRAPEGPLDLREDVRRCCDAIAAAGHDVIVVDQTSHEQRALGLRTVRVIAPGLLPMDFGWSRQRALRLPRLRAARRADPDRPLRLVPHPFS